MSRIILSFVALLAPLAVYAQQASPSPAKMAVVLEGIVLHEDSSPLTARTVFVFPIDQRGNTIRFTGITDDGKLTPVEPDAHPHAKTNANGRFRIVFSDSIAVQISDDTLLLGSQYAAVSVGVFAKEDLESLSAFAEPLFLTPQAGKEAQPSLKTEGNVLLIQFGILVLEE